MVLVASSRTIISIGMGCSNISPPPPCPTNTILVINMNKGIVLRTFHPVAFKLHFVRNWVRSRQTCLGYISTKLCAPFTNFDACCNCALSTISNIVHVVIFPVFVCTSTCMSFTVNTKKSLIATQLNCPFICFRVDARRLLRSLSPQGYSSFTCPPPFSPRTQLKPKKQTKYKIENIFNLIFFQPTFP